MLHSTQERALVHGLLKYLACLALFMIGGGVMGNSLVKIFARAPVWTVLTTLLACFATYAAVRAITQVVHLLMHPRELPFGLLKWLAVFVAFAGATFTSGHELSRIDFLTTWALMVSVPATAVAGTFTAYHMLGISRISKILGLCEHCAAPLLAAGK